MLVTISRILGAPVMSLRTGLPLAALQKPIVDPYSLRIVAFYVDGPRVGTDDAVLFVDDIREFGDHGAIVDSADNIMSPDGLVRLEKIIDYDFDPMGINVVDDRHGRMGKVSDYVVDTLNYKIWQIVVKPGLLQSLSVSRLIVHREQITKVEPDRFTVHSPTVKSRQPASIPTGEGRILNPEYNNPFRHANSGGREPFLLSPLARESA